MPFVERTSGAGMRRVRNGLFVLTCVVVALGIGSVLPRLVLAGEGVGGYSGEKEGFAEFALAYDSDLREWPFPVDPTVARRVTQVSGTHDENSPCRGPTGPQRTVSFVGDYGAEVVHYGPFFVPTGKNVFDCDLARTYSFLLPQEPDGVIFDVVSALVFLGAFGLVISTVFVPAFLTLGGGFLLARGPERSYRVIGLAALVSSLALVAMVFLAIAATVVWPWPPF